MIMNFRLKKLKKMPKGNMRQKKSSKKKRLKMCWKNMKKLKLKWFNKSI